MNPLRTEARIIRQLRKLKLVQAIDEDRWQTLLPHVEFTELQEGDYLFHAGHQSENLFLVIDGEVGLYLPASVSEDEFYLHSRKRGDTAGDFAVLNGGAHLVNAIATRKSRIAKFPRVAFELLTDMKPESLALVYDTAAELSRRVMLARVFLELFGSVTTETMNQLLEGTEIQQFKNGQVLFEEGDPVDGMFIVISGRLNVETVDAANRRITIAEVRSPHTVGELGLMSDSPRSGTVFATRESTVAFLQKSLFDELIAQRPSMVLSLARLIVQRNQHRAKFGTHHSSDQNFVFIPLDPNLPARRFLQQLKREMRGAGQPFMLDSRGFDRLYGKQNAAQTSFADVFSSAIAEWLDDKENRFSELLYLADPDWTGWTKRCVNRADRIVLLASPDSDHGAGIRHIEQQLQRLYSNARIRPKLDLVLLHPPDVHAPSGTARWLDPRKLDAFHHVRLDDPAHMARLGRRLCGTARAIVFSGGGARGYAHLGVQKMIEEENLDIDFIGGSSMGGLLGASMAMGLSVDDIYKLSERFANKRALYDYTLPVTALMKSAKLTRFCQEVYGDARIEDLWIPYFCVSSNLADGREVVHDRGELWRIVRSTISLPGIFAPVPTAGCDLLIDGAVLNTFPVDVMEKRLGGNGSIIGVNVSQIAERCEFYNYGPSLSGWQVLLSRLNPFARRIHVPRIAETLLRSTDIKSIQRLNDTRAMIDILIEPDVSQIQLLDFKSFRQISDIGYLAARRIFAEHGLLSNASKKSREAETPAFDDSVRLPEQLRLS